MTDEGEDAECFACAHAQALINFIFNDPQNENHRCPKVISVRRSSRVEHHAIADEEVNEQILKEEVELAAQTAEPVFSVPESTPEVIEEQEKTDHEEKNHEMCIEVEQASN